MIFGVVIQLRNEIVSFKNEINRLKDDITKLEEVLSNPNAKQSESMEKKKWEGLMNAFTNSKPVDKGYSIDRSRS